MKKKVSVNLQLNPVTRLGCWIFKQELYKYTLITVHGWSNEGTKSFSAIRIGLALRYIEFMRAEQNFILQFPRKINGNADCSRQPIYDPLTLGYLNSSNF